MGMFCDCTVAVPCDPHRCQFKDGKGKQCRAPRLWESAGCTRHCRTMPRVKEEEELETLEIGEEPKAAAQTELFEGAACGT